MVNVSYKDNDPKGWCGDPKRGAAFGRTALHSTDGAEFKGKLVLRRVRLNGDYDDNGTYWGGGPGTLPLYWYADEDGTIDACVRAIGREDAKRLIRARYPHAKFYR
jgi:hypothetical protein